MNLTTAQLQTLKTFLDANLSGLPDEEASAALNLSASPDFWVWRTRVSKAELVGSTSVDGTTFAWNGSGFIGRSQGERDAWRELFNGSGFCNPSMPNVRTAFQDIFSGGTAPAPANRAHLAAMCRRLATVAEELFAAGTGSTASPAVMGAEGLLTSTDVSTARNL